MDVRLRFRQMEHPEKEGRDAADGEEIIHLQMLKGAQGGLKLTR